MRSMRAAGRGSSRRSIERLKKHRAVFGSKLGWERPNWFAPEGTEPKDVYSMGRQNWFEPVGEEHRHVREKVGIFDQSSFAKYELTGKDAPKALDWICANDVAKPVGRLTYTQLLNTRGGIEADLTVARLAEEKFYIVTGTGFRTHDLAWIERSYRQRARCRACRCDGKIRHAVADGTEGQGRAGRVTKADVSNAAFPFGHVREIEIAGTIVRALRVTYVGELGWELHVPIAATGEVFDALMAAGKPHDIRPVGYRALESLRLEKGYRAWGSDITPNDTPFEAGLGWAVKLRKNTDFLGRRALEAVGGTALKKRFAGFTVDDPDIVLVGRETILRDGEPVGYLTSGGYGYTTGKNVGFGYVRNVDGVSDEFLASGDYELVVAMERTPAASQLGAPIRSAGGAREGIGRASPPMREDFSSAEAPTRGSAPYLPRRASRHRARSLRPARRAPVLQARQCGLRSRHPRACS